ncbi:MAG TPA: riboflavin synthase [Chitinophagaceae bacterium]|nr:riboflavin synthase [Chitinophagaceae bacterium]
MFTGIIQALGTVTESSSDGTNRTFWIHSPIYSDLKVDQSIAHDGVCLTVEDLKDGLHRVTAVKETIDKTNLSNWVQGSSINLERCLTLQDRLDGHFVQGHVDITGTCTKIKDLSGSWELSFEFSKKFAFLIIEKGSICINGVSLTSYKVKKNSFKVSIIPYTWEHTNFCLLKEGQTVNLEFDMIGKYINRKMSLEAN